jgi:hypothetical protein
MNARDEILHAIAAVGFVPKDFFLTQPPTPDKKDAAAWLVHARAAPKSIAQRMYRSGLTAHDLAPTSSELFAANGADGEVTQARRTDRQEPSMDVSKYGGQQFLNVAALKELEGQTLQARVVGVEESEKFEGKLELELDDGSIFTLSEPNLLVLVRAYGAESNDWLDKTIKLVIDTYVDGGGVTKEMIKLRTVTPPLPPEKKKAVTRHGRVVDDFGTDRSGKQKPVAEDLNDEIPFDQGSESKRGRLTSGSLAP